MAIFTAGTKLDKDKYEIVRLLGAGGFGITYLARNKAGEKVVLKFLNVQELVSKGKGATFGQRQINFINEAITLAKFDHPHIVKMYDMIQEPLEAALVKETGEKWLHGMVMEYIEGKTLDQCWQEQGIFSEAEGLRIIEQIGSALDLIHSKNHLHRDVKPQNIMLRADNREAVLIDFGLARQLSFEESVSMTGGATPAFAPPEQLAQMCDPQQQGKRGRFNPALDVYSLASTLYVLVAKQESPFIPLNNPMMTAWHMQMMKMSFTAPNQLNPKLSQRVSDGILQGMALEVKERPQSMQEWLALLGRVGNAHPTHGKSFVEDLGNGVKLEMVLIPAGSFMMGTPDDEIAKLCKEYNNDWFKCESPQHRVEIKEPFYMGKFLVTQGQWQAVMGKNPSSFKNGDNYPVDSVSWNDCQEFIKKLNRKAGKIYRLPSEVEWEYACRAETTTAFYFGETISADQANYDGNYVHGKGKKGVYRQKTTEVGSFPANGFGLYDMHGNLWEWCDDDWEANYKKGRAQISYKDTTSNIKVLRGGSWLNNPRDCRSADRYRNNADGSSYGRGFRLACSSFKTL